MMETTERNKEIAVQAFGTAKGKKILVINKRGFAQEITLPEDTEATSISYVAPSTGDSLPATKQTQGNKVQLEPYEVAVISIQ
jgi:hypothetical protein